MNETNYKILAQRKNISMVFSLMLVIIFVASIASYLTEINNIDKGVVTDFSNEWRTDLGVVADLNDIAHYDYIEKEIPDISSDCMLFFKTNNANVEVFKNNVCVLSTGKSKGLLVGKTNGKELIEIPIYTGDSGTNIRIDIQVPYGGNASISEMYIGNELTYVRNYIKDNFLNFIACSSLVIIGVMQVLLFVGGRKQGISLSMLFLGLFSVEAGIFLVIDSRFLQYAIGHSGSLHFMSEMVMSVMAIPFMYFIKYHSRNPYDKDRIFAAVVLYQYVIAFICFTFNALDVFDYHQTIFLCHIGYILTSLYTVYRIRLDIKNMNTYFMIHIMALLCMIVGAVADLVLYYVSDYAITTSFFVVGMLLFTLLEMTGLINGYIVEYKNSMMNDLENHLNFQDGLTDLYTKTTYTEEVKILSSQATNRVIALMRITGVSGINETYGYRIGDEILIYAAQKVKKHLDPYGKSYRLGGNELVFISDEGISTDEVKEKILELKGELLLPNGIVEEPIVMAYGVAVWESKERSYEEAFDDVVKIMFEHKRTLEI